MHKGRRRWQRLSGRTLAGNRHGRARDRDGAARRCSWASRTPGADREAEDAGRPQLRGMGRHSGTRGYRGSASQPRGAEGGRGRWRRRRAVPARWGGRGLHRGAVGLLPRPAARHVRPQARAHRLRRGSPTAHGRNRGRLRRLSMALE